MTPKTGIDWLDAVIDRDAPTRADPASRRDVRYALDHGFELEETLWMLDISDPVPGTGRKQETPSAAEPRGHVARRRSAA